MPGYLVRLAGLGEVGGVGSGQLLGGGSGAAGGAGRRGPLVPLPRRLLVQLRHLLPPPTTISPQHRTLWPIVGPDSH